MWLRPRSLLVLLCMIAANADGMLKPQEDGDLREKGTQKCESKADGNEMEDDGQEGDSGLSAIQNTMTRTKTTIEEVEVGKRNDIQVSRNIGTSGHEAFQKETKPLSMLQQGEERISDSEVHIDTFNVNDATVVAQKTEMDTLKEEMNMLKQRLEKMEIMKTEVDMLKQRLTKKSSLMLELDDEPDDEPPTHEPVPRPRPHPSLLEKSNGSLGALAQRSAWVSWIGFCSGSCGKGKVVTWAMGQWGPPPGTSWWGYGKDCSGDYTRRTTTRRDHTVVTLCVEW